MWIQVRICMKMCFHSEIYLISLLIMRIIFPCVTWEEKEFISISIPRFTSTMQNVEILKYSRAVERTLKLFVTVVTAGKMINLLYIF